MAGEGGSARVDGAGGTEFDAADLTPDQLRLAVTASDRLPHGRARILRAEALLAAADRFSDAELQFWALDEAVTAYQFGGESSRSVVPFFRLLRLWDGAGPEFAGRDRAGGAVHWMFKWMASSLLFAPEVPLATVETFIGEMETRYRAAGYSLRPVFKERFHLADHLGFADEARSHLERWRTAPRDRMSDCRACEHLAFGEWHAQQDEDQTALADWSDTLRGDLKCAEEPARTLAASLLPLVRLGRLDEARTNHLRGYRMVRGEDNLRGRVAQHIEFCACTGNEGRGLELLAEHRSWFDAPGSVYSQLSFHASVALLLRRVVELGSPDLPVPGPAGRDWAADELYLYLRDETRSAAARFDARNGTTAVGDWVADRIARQPLLDRLPLGARSGRPDQRPGRAERLPGRTAPEPLPAGGDPETLAAEALRLFRLGHPDSAALWERVAAVAEARGTDLSVVTRAELGEQRAASANDAEDYAAEQVYLTEAMALYQAAGLPGRAAALRAPLAVARARGGTPPRRVDPEALEAVHTEVQRLYDRGDADALDLLAVRFCQALDARDNLTGEPGPDWDADLERYESTALAFLTDAEYYDVRHRLGTGHFMLSEVALHREEPETALIELGLAVDFHEAAGRPWSTAHPRMALAQTCVMLGRSAEAEAAAHAALDLASRWPRLDFAAGYARQLLANLTNAQGRFEDSARHALEAAAWADRAGDAELAAGSRFTLAYAYEQLDRPADAAAVLESAMGELTERLAAPTVVEARWILGRSLSRLGDHRGAAESFLIGARVAAGLENQGSQAQLAAAAGHALKSAGLLSQARQAFSRSVELLRGVDDPVNLAKTLRALAWTIFEEAEARLADGADDAPGDDVPGGSADPAEPESEQEANAAQEAALDAALLCFADAEQLLDAAAGDARLAGDAPDDPPIRDAEIAFEIAETQDQLARLHLNADLAEKALPYAERAAAGFQRLLPARALDYDFSEQMIAWLLDRFLTRDAALDRLDRAIAVCDAAGVEAPRCAAYRKQLREA